MPSVDRRAGARVACRRMAMAPHRSERNALCDLFLRVGPRAPTLCAGWTTNDLVTHLVVREHKPLAALGVVLPGPFSAHLARTMARTASSHSYESLVAQVRSGPPPVLRPFDALINLTEFFVHHEDVRRGGGDTTPRPASDITDVEEALWRILRRASWFFTRGLRGTGLDLVGPDGDTIHARRGHPAATLTGRPGEIVLYLAGRKDAAQIEVGGPSEARDALRAASFGL